MAIAREQEFKAGFELNGFNKFLLILSGLALLVIIGWQIVTAPSTYTVDSKHWECTATEPDGIGARCTNLRMKSYALSRQ